MISELLIISVSAILINNYVLVQFLGICPFLGVSKKVDTAIGMGLAVIFVMHFCSSKKPSGRRGLHIFCFNIYFPSFIST